MSDLDLTLSPLQLAIVEHVQDNVGALFTLEAEIAALKEHAKITASALRFAHDDLVRQARDFEARSKDYHATLKKAAEQRMRAEAPLRAALAFLNEHKVIDAAQVLAVALKGEINGL